MPSPAKKRKLNDNPKGSLPSRGLEYFFAKQKDSNRADSPVKNEKAPAKDVADPVQDEGMTDEELARKLQAEWDREEAHVPAVANGVKLSPTPPPNPQLTKDGLEAYGMLSEPSKSGIAESASKGNAKGTLSLQSIAATIDTVSESIPFDDSPLTFDPDTYLPQLREHWAKDGGNASYALLTRCFVLVSGTSSRIKIVDTLVNCLRILIEGDPESLIPAVSSGELTCIGCRPCHHLSHR
jgi:DNA ligase-1